MANTPNLDLVKPAGTDKALVSVINSNSDKIDGGYGTLSEQIGHYSGSETGDDFNTLTHSGVYTVATSTHSPTGGTFYGTVIVSAGRYNYITQIATRVTAGDTYTRVTSDGGTTWSDWKQLAAGTEFNTVTISSLSDLKTYLGNMPVGKTSTLILSGDAANAVCEATFISNASATKINTDFADIRWAISNYDAGITRYRKTQQDFIIEHFALKSDLINAVNLSTNLTIDYADSGTIGYRTTETTKVDIQNLQGFPTGKTIICAYPHGYDDIYGANLWVDNSLRLRGTSKTSRTISVTITVFYI